MKSIFQFNSSNDQSNFIIQEFVQEHFTSPFHFHDSYELILIVNSYGKLYGGNKILNFSSGDVFLFGPKFPHCFYNDKTFDTSEEGMAHAIVIFFNEDFLGNEFFNSYEFKEIKRMLHKSKSGIKVQKPDEIIRSLFLKITKEKKMDALLLLLELLNNISKKENNLLPINIEIQDKTTIYDDATKLDPVLAYIMSNFKESLDSKYAASLACLNEAAFCRYFKRRTGKTFSQFVNNVRITHSKDLLMGENIDITRICFESGFRNISYFNRQFKDIVGVTPVEFRKTHHYSKNFVLAVH